MKAWPWDLRTITRGKALQHSKALFLQLLPLTLFPFERKMEIEASTLFLVLRGDLYFCKDGIPDHRQFSCHRPFSDLYVKQFLCKFSPNHWFHLDKVINKHPFTQTKCIKMQTLYIQHAPCVPCLQTYGSQLRHDCQLLKMVICKITMSYMLSWRYSYVGIPPWNKFSTLNTSKTKTYQGLTHRTPSFELFFLFKCVHLVINLSVFF